MAEQVRPWTTNQLHHCVHLLINHRGLRGLSCQTGGWSHGDGTGATKPSSGSASALEQTTERAPGNWVTSNQEMQKTGCHDKRKPFKNVVIET